MIQLLLVNVGAPPEAVVAAQVVKVNDVLKLIVIAVVGLDIRVRAEDRVAADREAGEAFLEVIRAVGSGNP